VAHVDRIWQQNSLIEHYCALFLIIQQISSQFYVYIDYCNDPLYLSRTGQKIRPIITIVAITVTEPAIYKGLACYAALGRNNYMYRKSK
jgi:hypothetical protein